MTVSLTKFSFQRRWLPQARGITRTAADQRIHRRVNTGWLLPAVALLLCIPTIGWLFSSGTAAAAWLVIDVTTALIGVPVALIAMRLFGYEDGD